MKLRRLFDRERRLRDRLAQIAHLLTGSVCSSILGLVGFALTARALGPTDYGILALCLTFTGAVEGFVSFQSWQPLIKYGAEAQRAGKINDLQSLLKFGLLLDISAAAIGWLVAVTIVVTAGPLLRISEDTSYLAVAFCSVLPFRVSGVPLAVLRLFGRFKSFAYGQVISSVFRLALCALGVVLGAGLFGFALIWMASQIINSLTLLTFAFIELRRQKILGGVLTAPLKGVTSRFPGIWRFAISTNLSLTIGSSANQVDTLLVGLLADPASAGFYHIAKRIGRVARQVGDQVQAVLYPELARAWASQDIGEFRRAAAQMQLLLLASGLVLVGGLYFTIKPVLCWGAGPEFVSAAPLIIIQSIAVTLTLCGSVNRSALLAKGRETQILKAVMASTIAFYATAFSLVPQVGPIGANIAHVVLALTLISLMMWADRYR
ncbi:MULTISPECIES: lipopolysaccharide biosynthesis protein [Neorhizobium]|jgi:O-antigen/teichoic acid export membrane protein|uniref:lipopolysaccharide biosynthesis protein n=1 Tax=Neorhizobium sp. T6_25 TaxID=2093833 RepID=UPI000CF9EE5A|nr:MULTISPECIES: oligosaccharide flippase family protein [Neorhizobium]